MKKRTGKFRQVEYTDGPVGNLAVVEDDLPPPDQLVFSEEKTRVTINLNETCVRFFKSEAKRHRTPYQKIIRSVLDGYVRNATKRAAQSQPKKKPVKTKAASKAGKGVKV